MTISTPDKDSPRQTDLFNHHTMAVIDPHNVVKPETESLKNKETLQTRLINIYDELIIIFYFHKLFKKLYIYCMHNIF